MTHDNSTNMAHQALIQFTNNHQTNPQIIRTAQALIQAALSHTAHPETAIDPDGEPYLDLRTTAGKLILAELTPQGNLNASIYSHHNQPLTSGSIPPKPCSPASRNERTPTDNPGNTNHPASHTGINRSRIKSDHRAAPRHHPG